MRPGEEQGDTKAKAGNSVSMAFGILSIIPQAHAFQVVRQLILGHVIGSFPVRTPSCSGSSRWAKAQGERRNQANSASTRRSVICKSRSSLSIPSTGRFNRASCTDIAGLVDAFDFE